MSLKNDIIVNSSDIDNINNSIDNSITKIKPKLQIKKKVNLQTNIINKQSDNTPINIEQNVEHIRIDDEKQRIIIKKTNKQKKEDIKQEGIKQEDIKQEDIKKEDIKQEDIKQEDIKQDIKQEDIKQEDIKQEDIKKDNIKQENIKKNNIKQEDIKQENIKKDNIKLEDIKKDNKDNKDKRDNINANKNTEILLDVSKLKLNEKEMSDKKNVKKNAVSSSELFNNDDVDYRNILTNYDFTKNITRARITKYEKALLIGKRAKQLEEGASPNVKVLEGQTSVIEIAEEELRQRVIPLIIRRPNGNSYEYWRPRDMEVNID